MMFSARIHGQEVASDWQSDARRFAEVQNWDAAMRVVDGVLRKAPQDVEAKTWRARILLWSGHVVESEREFRLLVGAAPQDPDLRLGLASALGREERWKEALRELDAAVEVDPKRADLHAARGRALRALRRTDDARQEFVTALRQEPASEESRVGLLSVRAEPKHELRLGTETNLFNFAGTYEGEWVSLTSHWTEHWGTSLAGNFYQRNATIAGKFIASATGRSKRWGGLTLGGASAHDVAIIPETEAFYGYDRGWRIGESGFLRGAEAALEEHWYWFTAARILTLNGTATFYLPRDWTWSLSLLGARSRFSSTAAEWRPSGTTRLGFPLAARGERRLSGNVFFAAGTENFALVDQVGRFSAQSYGGGFKFQFTRRQDLTAYAAYQKRTQDRIQTSFGFSYGIHF